MKAFLLMLKTEIKFNFVKMMRYPVQTLTSILVLYVLFMGVFYGSRSIAGVNSSPTEFAHNASSSITGYFLWFFALMAIDSMSQNIGEEALTGTLEQLYLSSWGFPLMLFLRFVSSVVGGLAMIIPLLVLLLFSTGVRLDPNIRYSLPIIGLTVLGLCGLGYILGAITIIFKRIGNAMTLIQFALLFLALSPAEHFPAPLQFIALTLPLTQGTRLLRLALFEGSIPLASMDFLILLVTSTIYLAVGFFIFRWAETLARDKGTLGHY